MHIFKKIYFLSILPFLLFTFLGAHRQSINGIYLDHIFFLFATTASIVALIFSKSISKKTIKIIFLFSIFIFINLLSLLINDVDYLKIYLIAKNIAYFSISIAIYEVFKKNPIVFFETIFNLAALSSLLLIIS